MSVAGGLAQQVAEALSGVALAQLVRAGAPCLYGSFFTATDMRTGAPAFGTPESVFGVLAGAAAGAALRPAVPRRGRARLESGRRRAGGRRDRSSCCGRRYLAGTDVVLHAAGWLEGGLCASFEKFALDVELLRAVPAAAAGIGFSEEEFAFDALKEVGPGGLFLASPHTREHFKEWLYMSPLFQTPDFATWEMMGSETAEVAANRPGSSCSRPTRTPASTPRSTRSSRRTWRAAGTRQICS